MVQRVTYRRRSSYRTKSNKFRTVKTPGGKLNVLYLAKRASRPTCWCGQYIHGVPAVRPKQLAALPKRRKHVTRAYGGVECSDCVRQRIKRAFLTEEQKIVKRMLKDANRK